MLLSEFSYISFLFYSDLDYIKLHACGDRFDEVVLTADTLAVFAKHTADIVAKQAISLGEEVKAFAKAKQVIDDNVWCLEDKEAYTFSDLVLFLSKKGIDYIEAIHETRNTYNDPKTVAITSFFDRILLFWDEEINYKNAARQFIKEEPSIIEVPKAQLFSPVEYGKKEFNKGPTMPITVSEWAKKFKDRTYSAEEIANEVNNLFNIKN